MKKALMIFYSAIKNELPEVTRIFQHQHSVNTVIKYSPKEEAINLQHCHFFNITAQQEIEFQCHFRLIFATLYKP